MKMMDRKIGIVLSVLLVLASFAVFRDADAASQKKKNSAPLFKPDDKTAVVSFVRRSVLMGDGWNYDVWDGDQYVGVLGAGNLLQERAAPGEHIYMLMSRGLHVWAFMKANLSPGKEYFARAYPLPFSLQPVDSNSDERVDTWATMKIDPPLTEAKRKKWIDKFGNEMHAALAAYRAGEIPADCADWKPPSSKGKERTQPSRSQGACRSIGDMKPEQGR